MKNSLKYDAITIGVSAGGLYALTKILGDLPAQYPIPIIVVQHRARDERTLLEEVLRHRLQLRIEQADEKKSIESPCVYFAPPDYHLLIEHNHTFSLSYEGLVNYSRPSIDVLFESAAEVYCKKLLGILLTGTNSDGAAGIQAIQQYGGTTIAQDPRTAQFPVMPEAAISTGAVQHVFDLDQVKEFLINAAHAVSDAGNE